MEIALPTAFERLLPMSSFFESFLAQTTAPVRVWIPESGKGAEAIALGIFLHSLAEKRGQPASFRLLVTERKREWLEQARKGYFDTGEIASLPAEVQERYFARCDQGWRIASTLRDSCVFSGHRFLEDPPFHRIDIISGFGLAERLEGTQRDLAASRLHYALRPMGVLLGHSSFEESLFLGVPSCPGVFRKNRLTARRGFLGDKNFFPWHGPGERKNGKRCSLPSELRRSAETWLVTRYAPVSFITKGTGQVLFWLGDPSAFLKAAPSGADWNLVHSIDARIGGDLQVALRECYRNGERVERGGIELREGGATKLSLEVVPLSHALAEERYFLITLREEGRLAAASGREEPAPWIACPRALASRNLLIFSRDAMARALLRDVASLNDCPAIEAGSFAELQEKVRQHPVAAVFLDIDALPPGCEPYRLAQDDTAPPLVIMTATGCLNGAMSAVRNGALDYLSKPLRREEVTRIIQRIASTAESSAAPPPSFGPPAREGLVLVGKSRPMVRMYTMAARAAVCDANVLITGETGTGKELVARSIHENSARKKRPFITVNSAALASTLLESELFGHVRGAFTGAVAAKEGLFGAADGGTLFLDEIGDISPVLQVKLLRAVQHGEYRPVGGPDVKRADVRIIAATHRDLEAMVGRGTFREDLYFRLKVISLSIPPLRERLEDLPDLIRYFTALTARRLNRPVPQIATDAFAALHRYHWPGNVRELEHAVEQAVALCPSPLLALEDFPAEVRSAPAESALETSISVRDVERARILEALQQVNFNKSRAASLLGISRVTLYRKVQRYGL